MTPQNTLNINTALQEIGESVMHALRYEIYPVNKLREIENTIDSLITDPVHLQKCENYFKSAGSNYVLFFISNIVYNLKTRQELHLTPDVLIWLGSVWKNFLERNLAYQNLMPTIDEYHKRFQTYYPGSESFVSQIKNVHDVMDDYLNENDPRMSQLMNLETFYHDSHEILNWMKPSYFFLMDYYYERRIMYGDDQGEAENFEKNGLPGFGATGYNYKNITFISCQALGILEAVYLALKKKKMPRKLISIEGKKKMLSIHEIYNFYLDRFNDAKKDLVRLKS